MKQNKLMPTLAAPVERKLSTASRGVQRISNGVQASWSADELVRCKNGCATHYDMECYNQCARQYGGLPHIR